MSSETRLYLIIWLAIILATVAMIIGIIVSPDPVSVILAALLILLPSYQQNQIEKLVKKNKSQNDEITALKDQISKLQKPTSSNPS